MTGRRSPDEIIACEAVTRSGNPCGSRLGPDWKKCPHHHWLGAEEFAGKLSKGATVPLEPSRDQLLGVGIHIADALKRGRDLSTLRLG